MNKVTHFIRTAALAAAAWLALAPGAMAQTPAAAQGEAPVIRLNVSDAIGLALKVSHRVGEVEAREDAAKASVSGRSAAGNPVVSLLAGYTRTNHVEAFAVPVTGKGLVAIYPDVPDNWRTRADVQWPVYTSGRVSAATKAADLERQATNRDVSTAKADIRLDATRGYWNLVLANAVLRVTEDALALVEAHLRDVRALRAAGIAAPNDVLTVQARRSRQQVLLIEARNNRDVAEADLRRATGIDRAARIELTDVLEAPARDAGAFDRLLAEARKARPERQALQLRVDAFGQQRTVAAAGTKPVVAVGAGVDYARPNPRIFPRAADWNETWDVGFNVTWPIWDGGRTKADVAQVSASQRAVVERLAEFDTELEFDVRQRQLDLSAAAASIQAATEEVASAAEARRVVTERFKSGLASNTDVLDAQQELVVAQLQRTQSLAAVRMAEARLDRALGR